ncbi:MAG: hypothetical protein N4A74_19840 [Carboxylicivirga sp.]|jgi:hypothetical protein|nr:hypothetical protein [Carboxylicivirga sp.]
MTWDNVADFLIWADSFGGTFETDEELIENACNWAHAFCDAYDLTGDPVFEKEQYPDGTWYNRQTDDCDGQPNLC